ncbi:response regulator [Roseococcus sp. SYP-B2431]|uniref:ATP-binding protein n=1 Tax=Roseococcus sp. SYP-B2431 TaxID=2496640 RepID=UPI0010396E4F|nr:ATP-binding protein [Roseococcus sp. SYP-B2431]TCH98778.1 response regulator [Roseococcus sp. SYP-B2431]
MSIRTRLLLLVLCAALIPIFLIGVRFVSDRDKAIRLATTGLTVEAKAAAAALNERIRGTAQLEYGLARARDLDTTDRAACSAFLAAVLLEHPQYTGLLTILPNGQLFCDAMSTGRSLDLRDRRYFQRAIANPGTLAVQPAFGRLSGAAVLQIAFAPPARDGVPPFVLLASLDLDRFLRDLLAPGTDMLLLTGDGTVLSWLPLENNSDRQGAQITGEPLFAFARAHPNGGAGQVKDLDGTDRIWATASVRVTEGPGLHVLIGRPTEALTGPANERLVEEITALAAVTVLLVLGVWLLAEIAIRRQVLRIGGMAARLEEGDLQARIPEPHPRGELGGLMKQLNRTAEAIQRQHAAIEELNRRLGQAQRMEAVGQLTGGIAHDFNNLLTVLLGNAEFLVDELADRPESRELALSMVLAAERGAELTRSLLAFARRQPLAPQAVDANRLVLGMEGLLRRTLGGHIEYRITLNPALWPAMVDPAQLESALLNLALNARDAMPSGGALTIETSCTHLDEAYAGGDAEVQPGDYVMVAVSDSGAGMTPETLAQAFEPFFTTKEVGKGTGLGLSMVYGFVRQTGGHIRLYSELGQGTTVKLYLPRADTAPAAAEPARPMAAPGAGEVVLVVEDNDLVRAHVVSEVKALGYTTVSAASGAEALHLVHDRERRIDLLFTDVVMPGGLSGPDLARLALEARPELKVLYTSGYTENSVVHNGRLDPGVPLLTKPYRRQELARKLREVLEG